MHVAAVIGKLAIRIVQVGSHVVVRWISYSSLEKSTDLVETTTLPGIKLEIVSTLLVWQGTGSTSGKYTYLCVLPLAVFSRRRRVKR